LQAQQSLSGKEPENLGKLILPVKYRHNLTAKGGRNTLDENESFPAN